MIYNPGLSLFVDAENGDYRLKLGSQAIDKGNNDYIPAWLDCDHMGNPRISNDLVDIGAYEYQFLPLGGLSANTKYTFVVQAVADELGIVSAIAKISAATINPAKYPAVSGFKATVDKNTNAVTLSWKESKVPDTTHYEVVVRDAAGEERKFDVVPGVSGVTVSDKGVITIPPITDLELGKYTILVRAVTAEGIKSVKDAKKVVTLK